MRPQNAIYSSTTRRHRKRKRPKLLTAPNYTWFEYMAGWCVRSGTAMPAESREYLDEVESSLLALAVLFHNGEEIFKGKRAVRRRVVRLKGDCS